MVFEVNPSSRGLGEETSPIIISDSFKCFLGVIPGALQVFPHLHLPTISLGRYCGYSD